MSVSFFRQHLKASPLPLSQAAPGFLSVGPGGWPTDGPTTAHQQKKKKHHVKKKYITRDTESKVARVRTHSVVSPAPGRRFFITARQRANGQSGRGAPTVRAHRPFTVCVCLSAVWGVIVEDSPGETCEVRVVVMWRGFSRGSKPS